MTTQQGEKYLTKVYVQDFGSDGARVIAGHLAKLAQPIMEQFHVDLFKDYEALKSSIADPKTLEEFVRFGATWIVRDYGTHFSVNYDADPDGIHFADIYNKNKEHTVYTIVLVPMRYDGYDVLFYRWHNNEITI